MPIRHRLLQAATALVLVGQSLVIAVFAFVFGPHATEGFASLDEPAEAVASTVRMSMAIGAIMIAIFLWACVMLLRSCLRGTPTRVAVVAAAVLEAALVVYAVPGGLGESGLMRGGALLMLLLCLWIDPATRAKRLADRPPTQPS